MLSFFDSPIQSIGPISPVYQKRLLKLGIKTIRDLFYHFPFRYDDFSQIKLISDLKLNEIATIQGEIVKIKNIRAWRKRMFITEAYVQDKSGIIKTVWFNQPFLVNTLLPGQIVSLSGKIGFDKTLCLSNPAYEKIDIKNPPYPSFSKGGNTPPFEKGRVARFAIAIARRGGILPQLRHTGRLVAVYPETSGVTSRWLRYIINKLLPQALPQIKDHLPPAIKKSQNLLDLNKALEQIHFPKTKKHAEAARRRLAFDELFLIQTMVLQQKSKWQKQAAPIISFNQPLVKKFVASLPFRLTNAQRKTAWEILQDLSQGKPMNRLLEGDVGSGKTVVSAIAALETASAGWQVAFMAPTEILAQQHFKEIAKLLKGHCITIGLLTANDAVIAKSPVVANRLLAVKQSRTITAAVPGIATSPLSASWRIGAPRNDTIKITKKEILKKVTDGQIQVLIGTHALIQEAVKFKNLALVILDEQHRFGVAQRAALQKNVSQLADGLPGSIPHLLSMTATPIPRTLSLTIYGDLDISLLDEMPKGRQEVITKIVAPTDRQKAYQFIRQQVKEGRQIFVICPRIEIANQHESSTNSTNIREISEPFVQISETKAVKDEYEKLSKVIFPDLKIAMIHGKLKAKEKGEIMADFSDQNKSASGENKIDILISTSVIEVGIDVPNATVMMIEGADRFGLAQLHQFRGRVGRGPHQSYCFLFTESAVKTTNSRLKALVACKNGFQLAEKDLQIRGPGEFYGNKQSGLPDLSMTSLTDLALVKRVREEAQKIIQEDPELKKYPLLKEKMKEFKESVHLE